ncbi:unnamed protein product, partial [marine sediment metagenome]
VATGEKQLLADPTRIALRTQAEDMGRWEWCPIPPYDDP